MSQIEEKPDSNLPSKPVALRPRRFRPISALIICTCLIAIVFARWYETLIGFEPQGDLRGIAKFVADHAQVNLLTFVLSFIALLTAFIWLARSRGLSAKLRFFPLLALGASIVLVPVLFDISVSAEMIPSFRPRWLPPPDTLLNHQSSDASSAKHVDLLTTTPQDYPQFLGPNRNLIVENIALDLNWEKHPPKELWRRPIGAGWSAFSAVNGFAVTMEQRGESELVTCYEIKTGKLRWSHSNATRHDTPMGGIGPRSTPTIHEGKVYALGAHGLFVCLDGSTGKVVWSKDLLREFGVKSPQEDLREIAWGRSNSPLIVDDMVLIPAGGPQRGDKFSLVAYQRETGHHIWRHGSTQISYSSPNVAVLAGKRQVIIVNEKNIAGFDLQGQELWSYLWDGDSSAAANVPQAVPVSPNRVFVSKGYSQGSLLIELSENLNPSEVWHNETLLKTKFANVVIHDGFVFGLSDGILECVELETGKRQWKRGRFGHGQILLAGNNLLVQSERGDVALVAANHERFEEHGRFKAVSGKAWNNLCLFGNRLLVRNSTEAACFELAVAK